MIKIITCFWNPGEFINKCINSILNQTYTNFKVFLVDDMSTDNSAQIIKNLIANDSRFFLIENKEKKLMFEGNDRRHLFIS